MTQVRLLSTQVTVVAASLAASGTVQAADTLAGDVAAGALIPVIAVLAAPVVADVYYVGKDIGFSVAGIKPSEESGRYEVYWTSWQAGIFLPLTGWLTIEATTRTSDGGYRYGKDDISALMVASTVPALLSAHGVWYGFPEHRRWSLGMAATADGLLLGYDLFLVFANEPAPYAYRVFEGISGIGQLLYGLSTLAYASDEETKWSLAALAVPAALTTHALLSDSQKRSSTAIGFPLVHLEPIRHQGLQLSLTQIW